MLYFLRLYEKANALSLQERPEGPSTFTHGLCEEPGIVHAPQQRIDEDDEEQWREEAALAKQARAHLDGQSVKHAMTPTTLAAPRRGSRAALRGPSSHDSTLVRRGPPCASVDGQRCRCQDDGSDHAGRTLRPTRPRSMPTSSQSNLAVSPVGMVSR
eukprot:scaffold140153_cov60-Phaeocystis_antarctica.AAC.5